MAARLTAIVLDLVRAAQNNEELLRELFDSDTVGALAFALRWARKDDCEALLSSATAVSSSSSSSSSSSASPSSSSAATALGIVRDASAALLALLRARRDLVVHDLRRASAKSPGTYRYACAVLAHAQLQHELGPTVLEIMHACAVPGAAGGENDDEAASASSSSSSSHAVALAAPAPADLQAAMLDERALFPLLELCHHASDAVKRMCLQLLIAVCHDCDRNKAALRERHALSMLATFLRYALLFRCYQSIRSTRRLRQFSSICFVTGKQKIGFYFNYSKYHGGKCANSFSFPPSQLNFVFVHLSIELHPTIRCGPVSARRKFRPTCAAWWCALRSKSALCATRRRSGCTSATFSKRETLSRSARSSARRPSA